MSINIQAFTFNPFGENTYVLFDESREAVIIDPGCYDKSEQEILFNFIEEYQLKPIKIINTHAHIDHVLGVAAVKRKYKIPFLLHKLDEPLLLAVKTYASNYGFAQFDEPQIDAYIKEGVAIAFGNSSLEVRFVPGHAPGHVAFVDPIGKQVVGGDVLFRQSIGRTDLPGGDMQTLLNSIRTQLFTLPDDYKVYAGHMEPTSIGFEKQHNPFLR